MDVDYQNMYNILDELKIEVRKTSENIRKGLLHSRPVIFSQDQLEDYIKRVEFANEIMLKLDYLMKATFDTYIDFINTHWETKENFESLDAQRLLTERYEISLKEWQGLICKIERFHEVVKQYT